MRHCFTRSCLAGIVLLSATARLAAQTPEARNLATDTLQPANPKFFHPISRIRTNGGKTLYIFIARITDKGDGIEFTWRNPMTFPRPKPAFIATKQFKWLWMDSVYYEPVRLAGEEAGVLAQRVLTGPKWELLDVATLKKGVPIPIPGLMFSTFIWTGAFRNNYNHAWYLRRPGELLMQAVPKGRDFAPTVAGLLADAPALAAGIEAQTAGYQHDDMPQLIDRYNKIASATPVPR